MPVIEKMLEVARRHSFRTDELETDELEIATTESYIPYFPPKWNGILVLAESQNLSDPQSDYAQWLASLSPECRLLRLTQHTMVGVAPWDDGSMKLMLASMNVELDIDNVAVGNAVPWSCRDKHNRNVNPTELMKTRAVSYWNKMIPVLSDELQMVITFGKVAKSVIGQSDWNGPGLTLRLPSPIAMNRLAGMFDQKDLLARYPEVKKAHERLKMTPNPGRVLFACHAASLGKKLILAFDNQLLS